jgi:hypothetical protein
VTNTWCVQGCIDHLAGPYGLCRTFQPSPVCPLHPGCHTGCGTGSANVSRRRLPPLAHGTPPGLQQPRHGAGMCPAQEAQRLADSRRHVSA